MKNRKKTSSIKNDIEEIQTDIDAIQMESADKLEQLKLMNIRLRKIRDSLLLIELDSKSS